MIFVTVGTHEQQFDRLIKEIDILKKEQIIKDDVFIQTGFSDYTPKYCKWSKLISFQDMEKYNKNADIIITHGGPASFILALQNRKIPIVVPRQAKYKEHINDHQLFFAKEVEKRNKNIIVVEDIGELKSIIINYNEIIKKINNNTTSNNEKFCLNLEKIIEKLVK